MPGAGVQILNKDCLILNNGLNTAPLTRRLNNAPLLLSIQPFHKVILKRHTERGENRTSSSLNTVITIKKVKLIQNVEEITTLKCDKTHVRMLQTNMQR